MQHNRYLLFRPYAWIWYKRKKLCETLCPLWWIMYFCHKYRDIQYEQPHFSAIRAWGRPGDNPLSFQQDRQVLPERGQETAEVMGTGSGHRQTCRKCTWNLCRKHTAATERPARSYGRRESQNHPLQPRRIRRCASGREARLHQVSPAPQMAHRLQRHHSPA